MFNLGKISRVLEYEGNRLFHALKPRNTKFISPSRNLLTREAFQAYNNLPVSNHCVAMSLHFLKNYRETKNISDAANSLKEGCHKSCAKTSMLYHELFNSGKVSNDAFFLSEIREAAAHSLGLKFTEEVRLKIPPNKTLAFICENLDPGEYILPLPNHLTALVKESSGKIALYNSNHGTVDLEKNHGYFLKLLKSYHMHLNEDLSLLKVSDFSDKRTFKYSKVVSENDKPSLVFAETKKRFGAADFTWRGKTYSLVRDAKTGEIYNSDSKLTIRIKCALLIPKSAIDGAVRAVYHLGVTILKSFTLPLVYALYGKEKSRKQCHKIRQSFADVFRAPMYAILCEGAAVFGLFKPYEGRRLYGYFERCLNRQNAFVNFHKKYYSARCFKPWNFGIVEDENATKRVIKKNILHMEERRKCKLIKY